MITREDTFHFWEDKRYDDLYCGFVDYFNKYMKYYPITKKMKSKSKQPRYIRVVMKGEWK